jgi:hypothetical protein
MSGLGRIYKLAGEGPSRALPSCKMEGVKKVQLGLRGYLALRWLGRPFAGGLRRAHGQFALR